VGLQCHVPELGVWGFSSDICYLVTRRTILACQDSLPCR